MNYRQISKMIQERVVIERQYEEKQTVGFMTVKGKEFFTVELPWKDNQKQKSCIPEGVYLCTKRHSQKYGWHYLINDVPNRSYCLIHAANFSYQLLGCIAPGNTLTDINGDGLRDVTSSRNTVNELLELLGESFVLEIKNYANG